MNLEEALKQSLSKVQAAPTAEIDVSYRVEVTTHNVGVILDAIESMKEITSLGQVKVRCHRERYFNGTVFSIDMVAPAIIVHNFLLILKFIST